jgi:hypothetical protein
MGGIELMLKSLGFDPTEFQKFLSGMQTTLQKFNADLEQLKTVQAEMLNRLSQLESNQRVLSNRGSIENGR